MTYTYNEAFEASKKYFEGDELAARVWATKYALKDSQGNYFELTPDDMHRRIAREIARIEKKYKNPMDEQLLFDLMSHFRYLVPQGSPMAGIGNNLQVGSLSNCFVIGLKGEPDSYGGIIKIDEEQVQLMKRRGGGILRHFTSGSGARFVASSSKGCGSEKFSTHFHRFGAIYGALFQFHS